MPDLQAPDRDAARVWTIPFGADFLATLIDGLRTDALGLGLSDPAADPLSLARVTIYLPTRRAVTALRSAWVRTFSGAALLPDFRPIGAPDEEPDAVASLIAGLRSHPTGAPPGTQLPANLSAPPIGDVERRIVLTHLVLRWAETAGANTLRGRAVAPGHAIQLADELIRTLDEVETEGADLSRLSTLVREEFSHHWALTLDFLRVITEFWPAYLAASGQCPPAALRNATLDAAAQRLIEQPPANPVIVAGVTGSVPATRRFMCAVAGLPAGRIILPGVDQALPPHLQKLIMGTVPEHPQHCLLQLLSALEKSPEEVQPLRPSLSADGKRHQTVAPRDTQAGDPPAVGQAADTPSDWPSDAPGASPGDGLPTLLASVMAPVGEDPGWARLRTQATPGLAQALDHVSLLEAADAEEEAHAITLALRETAEHPERTAALVTPDRRLARRVEAKLQALGLAVDDSAGRPLAKTPPGAFMDLVIGAFDAHFAPVETMALLKHPLCRLGLSAGEVRRAARLLELHVLRAEYFGTGIAGLRRACLMRAADAGAPGIDTGIHHPQGHGENSVVGASNDGANDESTERTFSRILDLLDRLEVAFAPLSHLRSDGAPAQGPQASGHSPAHPLRAYVAAHCEAAIALAASGAAEATTETASEAAAGPTTEPTVGAHPISAAQHPLCSGEGGRALMDLVSAIMAQEIAQPEVMPDAYGDAWRALATGVTVRNETPAHPRIFIWGPYEARLMRVDRCILGGLNDGVWPEIASPDAWLNRPMRRALGLPAPEFETGLAAHDFCSLLGQPEVILTRAQKIDGSPTVRSRWLMRMDAALKGLGRQNGIAPREVPRCLAWARTAVRPPQHTPRPAPAPQPPVRARPRRISVTRIGEWIANPYAVFASEILRLRKLPSIQPDATPALRGTLLHGVLQHHATRFAVSEDDNPPDNAAVLAMLMAIARENLAAHGAHHRMEQLWLPRLERFLSWFLSDQGASVAMGHRTWSEIRGTLVLPAPAGPFEITARADRIDVAPNGAVRIIDYKSGTAPSQKKVLALLAPQLPLEALMVLRGAFPLHDLPKASAPTALPELCIGTCEYIRAKGGLDAADHVVIAGDKLGGAIDELGERVSALVARYDDPQTAYPALRRAAFADRHQYDDYAQLARVAEWSTSAEGGADAD